MPHKQICWVGWGRGVFAEEKKNYEDGNQTKNFIKAKTGNNLYYRGEKHY